MPALPAQLATASGAGDCLVAGCCWSLLKGQESIEALAHGMVRLLAAVRLLDSVLDGLSSLLGGCTPKRQHCRMHHLQSRDPCLASPVFASFRAEHLISARLPAACSIYAGCGSCCCGVSSQCARGSDSAAALTRGSQDPSRLPRVGYTFADNLSACYVSNHVQKNSVHCLQHGLTEASILVKLCFWSVVHVEHAVTICREAGGRDSWGQWSISQINTATLHLGPVKALEVLLTSLALALVTAKQ